MEQDKELDLVCKAILFSGAFCLMFITYFVVIKP